MSTALLGLTPLLEVMSCERAIALYRQLGFEVTDSAEEGGHITWARLSGGGATLMIGRYEQLEPGRGQHAMMCLSVADAPAFRAELSAKGVRVSEMKHPPYAPGGEFSVCDENGYLILISSPP